MPAPYSYDLRVKVMQFLDTKKTIKEASKLFRISRKTIMEWKKLRKASGDVKSKEGYRKGHSHIFKDLVRFKEFIKDNPNKSAVELAKLWDKPVSASTILRALNKLGYSFKKKFYSSQKGREGKGRISGKD